MSVSYVHSLTLPLAVNYAASFSAQATATYSVVSTGASPTDAALASHTEVSPGTGAPGAPLDPQEQGTAYNVDHIFELQFVVGAFQLNPRPYVMSSQITLGLIISRARILLTSTKKLGSQDLHRFPPTDGLQPQTHASPGPKTIQRKYILPEARS